MRMRRKRYRRAAAPYGVAYTAGFKASGSLDRRNEMVHRGATCGCDGHLMHARHIGTGPSVAPSRFVWGDNHPTAYLINGLVFTGLLHLLGAGLLMDLAVGAFGTIKLIDR